MQLTPAARREVVEEILDIKIFSMMNKILKFRTKDMKERQMDVKHQFVMLDSKIEMSSEHIGYTEDKKKTSKSALEKKIKDNQDNLERLETQAAELDSKVDDWRDGVLPKQVSFLQEQKDFVNTRWKIDSNSQKMEKEVKFFEDNDECPTCEQTIDIEAKVKAMEKRADKMMTNACALIRMDEQLGEMDAREELYNKIAEDAREWEVESAKRKAAASSAEVYSKELKEQIAELSTIDEDLTAEKTKLKMYMEELELVEKQKNRLTEDNNYLAIAKQLLQDSGIKSKIIKRYLPVMNRLINSYLSALEFPAQFELDEEFKETIKSRYRDVFSYANFSEGEKMRIDLALLFTWRQIAKMKNSTNTNLLVLDEIFDSSLDYNGTDEFLKILNTLSDENVFVISHKSDLNVDKFEGLVRFEKVQNFSRMTT
jgi:DNA repair exonuclease SbcCD ATPase subunit